jgi:hypothetical protein
LQFVCNGLHVVDSWWSVDREKMAEKVVHDSVACFFPMPIRYMLFVFLLFMVGLPFVFEHPFEPP